MKPIPKDIQARLDEYYKELTLVKKQVEYLAQKFSNLEWDLGIWIRNTTDES